MEKNEGKEKVGCVRFFWALMAVVLCASQPCLAVVDNVYVFPGDIVNVEEEVTGTIYLLGGTVNILDNAIVHYLWSQQEGTVNLKGGIIDQIGITADTTAINITIYGEFVKDSLVTNGGSAEYNATSNQILVTDSVNGWTGTLQCIYEGESVAYTVPFSTFSNINFTIISEPKPLNVDIDIKPGSDPNPINPGSNGLIPVAILTTDTFNAADVDPGTVTLNEATVAVRGKSLKLMARLEDVDGDGDDDLMLQVETESWAELGEDGEVILIGETYEGQAIEGKDYVVIVPPE